MLGGKNLGRYTPNNISFPLDANQNPTLFLQTLSVSATGTPPWGDGPETLLFEPALVQIDSTTPFIWLPESACRQAEKALGLVWNSAYNLYLMNDTSVYSQLQALNMTFQFKLSAQSGGQDSVSINVPFSSLDLDISWPYVNTTDFVKYFPLKRASGDQYTLGRSFLQEAYLAVDYDRGNFSVHQALYPPLNDQIVAIEHPDSSPDIGNPPGGGKLFPTGIVVGVAVSAALVALAIIGFCFYRRRKRLAAVKRRNSNRHDGQERIWEVDGDSAAIKPNYSYHQSPNEMAADDVEVIRSELTAVNFEPAELGGTSREVPQPERFSWEDDTDTAPPYRYHNNESPPPGGRNGGSEIELSPVSPHATSRPVSDMSPTTTLGGYNYDRHASGDSPISPAFRH